MSDLTNENIVTEGEFNNHLHARITRIKLELGLDDSPFLEMLGMKSPDYLSMASGSNKYQLKHLLSLSQALDITIDQLVSGEIDLQTLALQFHGQKNAFPEKYQDPRFRLARVRSIKSIFNYLRLAFGEEYARGILSRLQVLPHFLNQPNQFVSTQLLFDLLDQLRYDGLSDRQFIGAGEMNSVVNANSDLAKILADKKTPRELCGFLEDSFFNRHYDQLFSYRLTQLTNNNCTHEITLREDTKELFRSHILGNRTICLFKQGVGISFLSQFETKPTLVESRCMYQGDSSCVYHIHWENSPETRTRV